MTNRIILLLLLCCASYCQAQPLYNKIGEASFYGKRFDGRKTANGEIFSSSKLTAAHRTLPFGTIVRVTNLKNNKSVVVRINDRGPYIKGRIIDLSRAAADSLDFIHSGWTSVRVEALPPAESIDTSQAIAVTTASDSSQLRFPEDWLGTWHGDLNVYSSAGLQQQMPMQLDIAATDSANLFTWSMRYGDQVMQYTLRRLDSSHFNFLLHEGNAAEQAGSILSNTLCICFTVNDQLQDYGFTLRSKNEMDLVLHAGSSHPLNGSAQVVSDHDSIPQIKTFYIASMQTAQLFKVK